MKSWTIGAAAAVVLAAIIATSYLALPALVAVLCAAAVLIGLGWPRLLALPSPGPLTAVIAATGIVAVIVVWLAPDAVALGWSPLVVAGGIIAAFVVQLLRGTGSRRRLESMLGATSGVLLAGMSGGWVAAEQLSSNAADSPMMLVTGISSLVAICVCMLPWPDRLVAPVGFVAAAAAGPAAAMLLTGVPVWAAIAVGAVCAAIIVSMRRLVVAAGSPMRRLGALAIGVAPISALGSLVYLLERLMLS